MTNDTEFSKCPLSLSTLASSLEKGGKKILVLNFIPLGN